MSLEAAIQAVGARNSPAASRMGVVTAINTGAASLTVSIAGDEPLTGVRWIQSYTPVVDDFVVLLKVGGGWWVLGKNSRDLRAGNLIYDSVTIPATTGWDGQYHDFMTSWNWTTTANPWTGIYDLGGGGGGSGIYAHSALFRFDFSALPSGATVLSAKVNTNSVGTPYSSSTDARLRQHTNTTRPTAAPTWVSGFIPVALSAPHQQAFDLPSAWVTALLSGSSAGLGFQPDSYGAVSVGASITIAYSIPG